MPAGDPTTSVQPWLSTSEPEPLARAFGYVRLGRDAELGLLRQSRAIERVCRERGLALEGLLSDEPGSAGDPGPALRRALGRIVAGDASALVVARLDSLAASAAGVGAMMEWFSRNDARFLAVDLELDTATPGGRLAADALRAAGELERRMLQERTRRGLDAAREKGARPGRPAVADRPELRERIRMLRTDGWTLQAIADELNADGVPTLRGGSEWRPSSVQSTAGYKRPGKGARPGRPARKRSSPDTHGRARARMSREYADVRNGTVAYTGSGRTSPAICREMGHKGAMHTADRGLSRTQFIAAGAVAAGAAAAVGVAGGPLEGTNAQTDRDIEALQLILLLEYTENAFYAEAIERGGLSGEMKDYAQSVLAHEREHLAFLKQALGARAEDRPSFEFGSATSDPAEFAATAAELEDLAVGAYNGQATNVSKATLEAAATVVSVEARHAAWVRSIVGEPPAPDATDKPLSAAEVREGLERIGMR